LPRAGQERRRRWRRRSAAVVTRGQKGQTRG
jgi:hypothetical protein